MATLNHLHLAVADVQTSKAFYESCFGFREKIWHGRILFMTDSANFDLALDPKYKPSALPDWYQMLRLIKLFRMEQKKCLNLLICLTEIDKVV